MKKISLLVIFLHIVVGVFCQPQQKDIVLSKKVQKINKQKEIINSIRVYHKPENLPLAIKAYEDLFAMDPPLSVCGPFYRGYADVLAQSGNLTKAITYYDLAINNGFAEPDEFGYTYRKEYFAKDTALYNRKLKANPDTELVNKRRRWLGLPPLQELKKDEFMIMPAYD